MEASRFEEALALYRQWGLSMIPLPYRSKKATINWKQYQERPPTEEELNGWFRKGEQWNVGLVCGSVSQNLVALDFDDGKAFWEFAERFRAVRGVDVHEQTPVVSTSRGYHVYLRTRTLVKTHKFAKGEVRGEGSYVVAPPSVHADGSIYELVNPEVDILVVGDLREVGIEVDGKEETSHEDSSWVAEALQGVPEGQRDATCIRLAGHYKAKGLCCEETLTLLRVWAEKCHPPFSPKEVEKCVRSSYRYLATEGRNQGEALAEAREATLKWLQLEDANVVDIALAAVTANRADGDPLWVLLVGAPSTGKTEILRGLFNCEGVHPLGGFTANTFASGFERVRAGLLEKLPDHVTLVVKDFGTLFTMRWEERAVILQQLREIYDGYYRKDYGNGKVVEWKGSMGLLAACTSAIENYHAVIGELGNRYILYRCELKDDTRESVAHRALDHEGIEDEMRREIASAYARALAKAPDAGGVRISASIQDKLASLASLVAQLRSQVSRDPYDKTVNYAPDIEGPARLVKAFAKLGKGLAAVRGENEFSEPEYEVVVKVALDTIPRRRCLILASLVDLQWKSTKEVSIRVDIPTSTVNRELEDLAMVKVVSREFDSDDGDRVTQFTPYRWRLKEGIAKGLVTSGLMETVGAM